jgi:hypothetical protein
MVKRNLSSHRSNQIHALLDTSKVIGKEKPPLSQLTTLSQDDLTLAKTLFMAFIVFSVCWYAERCFFCVV